MNEKLNVIGENTSVRIGVLLGIMGALAAAIWWASAVNSKLDTILTLYQGLSAADNQHVTALAELKGRVDKLEFLGSPKAVDLDKRLNELERKMKP